MQINKKIINLFKNNNENLVLNKVAKTNAEFELVLNVKAINCQKNIDINFTHEQNSKIIIKINCISSKNGSIKINVLNNVEKNIKKCFIDQQINGLILTNNSSIHVEPKMFIKNNKIIASHAVNIGRINLDKMFYLLSRNIPYEKAVNMLKKEIFSF
ncbi:MAG: SufD family Fe-S cluster assembly protein [Mycoplasmataceae bacterium]|jgi:Fe-S cluster assembly scaffold protein SufB|nr:SufD family Fe-S cluster assembly protein [Mycoplasmataceae bacterium]